METKSVERPKMVLTACIMKSALWLFWTVIVVFAVLTSTNSMNLFGWIIIAVLTILFGVAIGGLFIGKRWALFLDTSLDGLLMLVLFLGCGHYDSKLVIAFASILVFWILASNVALLSKSSRMWFLNRQIVNEYCDASKSSLRYYLGAGAIVFIIGVAFIWLASPSGVEEVENNEEEIEEIAKRQLPIGVHIERCMREDYSGEDYNRLNIIIRNKDAFKGYDITLQCGSDVFKRERQTLLPGGECRFERKSRSADWFDVYVDGVDYYICVQSIGTGFWKYFLNYLKR